MTNKGAGLATMPINVVSALNMATLAKLKRDGHGLSFPVKSGCQMRFTRNKKNLGGFYSYNQWGSIAKAIDAAINRNLQLRAIHPKTNNLYSPTDNVQWDERLDKRINKIEFRYRAYYKNSKGKSVAKTFSFGHKRPSADKQLHGFNTAKLFRHFYMVLGNDFDMSIFSDWKEVRLYTKDRAVFNWAQD